MVSLEGKYTFTVTTIDGAKVSKVGYASTITYEGLDRLMEFNDFMDYCQIGRGRDAASPFDSELKGFISYSNTLSIPQKSFSYTEDYIYTATSKTFAMPVQCFDIVVSEVGVGWNKTGCLFSRSLIRDLSGNLTEIPVYAGETLEVTYILNVIPSVLDIVYTAMLLGVKREITLRNANVANPFQWTPKVVNITPSPSALYNGPIGAFTSSPTGTKSMSLNAVTLRPYKKSSYAREFVVSIKDEAGYLDPDGISAILLSSSGSTLGNIQISIDPPISIKDIVFVNLSFSLPIVIL